MERVGERFCLNYVSEELPCREEECKKIEDYVKFNLISESSGTMYISGMPGTGKTACVLKTLQTLHKTKKVRFNFVVTNGMQLGDIGNLYIELNNKILPAPKKGKRRRTPPATCLINLKQHFSGEVDDKMPVVLVIDELDALVVKKQRLLYNIFEWTTLKCAKLTIISIANTLDLPERMLSSRIFSRFGLNRLCFSPYTFDQIEKILTSRLEDVSDFVEPDAISLIARKVASISGDLRRALEMCRLAFDFCFGKALDDKPDLKKTRRSKSIKHSSMKLSIAHATQAAESINSGSKIMAVKCASQYETLFLKSMLAEFNAGVEDTTCDRVFDHFKSFCHSDGFPSPTFDDFVKTVFKLGAIRLIIVEYSTEYWKRKLRLNINAEDLKYALGLS